MLAPLVLLAVIPTLAGPPESGGPVRAVRLDGPVVVDGVLSEPVWRRGDGFSAMLQRDPAEGQPASLRTEVRVAYDDEALYVGACLFDPAPDSIQARLARRDASITSDRFTLYLDPYHDRRGGYYFRVNAAGTLYDGTLSNDVENDASWDGVWQGAAHLDSVGWCAEMRIPYSQLRFPKAAHQVWGINFQRDIPRRRESDYAAYRPRKESGFVSRFPDLVGVDDVNPGTTLELMPYITTRGEYLAHEAGDPFNDGSRLRRDAGGDLRLGLGQRLTLNATIRPDFGQVEVDPARVNLTDVESFFDEKRPFFVDGASAFAFGRQGAADYWDFDWEDPTFFYTRRIGREPQGKLPSADYADVPLGTRILSAAKLTGRPAASWTLGSLVAVTAPEEASLRTADSTWHAAVEPFSRYGVVRAQHEVRDGRAGLGVLGTAAWRELADAGLHDQLARQAVLGGADGWWFLDDRRRWVISGWWAYSHVQGDSVRMIALQRNSTHYFQRPDASHVEVDSSATSLEGYGARLWLIKQKGSLQFNAGVGALSPGFEANDLGFLERADLANAHVGMGYRWTHPSSTRRFQSLKAAAFGTADYGGNVLRRGLSATGFTDYSNGWTWTYYGTYSPWGFDNRRTRGGPLMRNPAAGSIGTEITSDTQHAFYYYVLVSASRDAVGSYSASTYPSVQWKPATFLNLKLGPGVEWVHSDAQYVTSQSDTAAWATYGVRHVFARLEQLTVSSNLRLNWTFTPHVSLECYVQPFVSAARYRDFKALVRARSREFAPAAYTDDPDFTVASLKGNAVLRWEYRPGSTLYLVWTQKRSDTGAGAVWGPWAAFEPVARVAPENVVAVKLSYWFSP